MEEVHDREEEVDIGDSQDSISDRSNGSDTEMNQTFGPMQYTEADVLRCLSEVDKEEAGEIKDSGLSCPSCRGQMATPVLNVSCWHLKCEDCWLRAVGTRKVCSICAGPASVKELRRVHV